MESIKSFLGGAVILAILVLGGYWAVATIEPGSLSVQKQKQAALEEENEALREELEEVKNELRLLKGEEEATPAPAPTGGTTTPAPTTTSKYQTLIAELEQLVKDNITMKEKSRGTRVGTIQNFLNIYNGTNNRVDNDYGKTTKAAVAEFQKDMGLTADGEAGPATFQKMIDWLKQQG